MITYSSWNNFSCIFTDLFFSPLSLDPEQKDQLIEVIEKLLADKTTVCFSSLLFVDSVFSPDFISSKVQYNFANHTVHKISGTSCCAQHQIAFNAPVVSRLIICLTSLLFHLAVFALALSLGNATKPETDCRSQSVVTGFLYRWRFNCTMHGYC